MTGVPVEFLDEVLQYLENSVLEDLSNSDRYVGNCTARPFSSEMMQIKDISYYRRNEDDLLTFVNNELAKGGVTYKFHCQDGIDTWSSWSELLTSFWARLNVNQSPPYVLQWESRGDLGVLKADENFDEERYLIEDISAEDALCESTIRLIHEYLPRDEALFDIQEVKPEKIKALIEENLNDIRKL